MPRQTFMGATGLVTKFVVTALMLMMLLVVVLATVELAVLLFNRIFTPPGIIFAIDELLDVFGFFFLVLIGLELFETIRIYLKDNEVHVEVVFLVAMIAVARKVIIMDVNKLKAETIFAIAAVIIALTIGFFFVRRGMSIRTSSQKPADPQSADRQGEAP